MKRYERRTIGLKIGTVAITADYVDMEQVEFENAWVKERESEKEKKQAMLEARMT